MNPPKVSVIIPVYNTEPYLRQCLDSVTAQTLTDIEILCVDDGSTDRSPEIVLEYAGRDPRVRLIRRANEGAGAARNAGMDEARGRYLYFMDSDDFCEPALLAEASACAEESGADIVVFDYCKYDQKTGQTENRKGLAKDKLPAGKASFSRRDIPDVICSTVLPTPWNKLFLREPIMARGLRYLPISTTNDITFATLAVLCAEKIVYLEKTFLHYRVNAGGTITSMKRDRLGNIITAVLSIDEQAQRLPFYREVRRSVREFAAQNLFIGLDRYAGEGDSAQRTAYLRQIDAIFYGHPLFLGIGRDDFCDAKLFSRVVKGRARAMERGDLSYAPELIVSLTSFPARIGTVHRAIRSIAEQTRKPDRILLWLARSQFPGGEADLPQKLLDYRRLGLEICWCEEDLRPHKKYFYAMQAYPEALIVTVDDDLTYEPHMLEALFASYLRYPLAVSATRVHLMARDEKGNIAPYAAWKKEDNALIGVPSMQLFATCGAGTLFPPHCLSPEVFDMESIRALCLNADDLWLKVMQVRAGTPVVLVRPQRPLAFIDGTQGADMLMEQNVHQAQNDVQLRQVLERFGQTEDGGSVTDRIFAGEAAPRSAVHEADPPTVAQQAIVLLREENAYLAGELQRVRRSWSYRLGRAATLVPRKIHFAFLYCRAHGMKYALRQLRGKLTRKA